jgi:BirA family biotin operon repressor/biotin-[acetyl-CoA-carboxylase] ligase
MAAAEDLLAALVRAPAGISAPVPPAALATLRARGHAIDIGDRGARLRCAASHFDPAAFVARGALGRELEVWETTTSTSDLARAGAERGAPAGTTWLAESQTAGRGRQGRAWLAAPHAALLVSFLTDLDGAPLPTLLPLAVGLGAREAIAAATGVAVQTKWPNDLLLGDRKLAGTLVEVTPSGRAIVGLGLNVQRAAIAPFELPVAAALDDAGPTPRRESLLAALLAGIEQRIDDWRTGRHAALRDAYLEHESTLDRAVCVREGGALVEGRVRGLTPAGGLRLVTGAGTLRTLVAGDLHFVRSSRGDDAIS